MGFDEIWTEHELFFHHEFINAPEFPESKKKLLKKDLGRYYIPNDFTIYQEKDEPVGVVTKNDYFQNSATFLIILYHLPFNKVPEFLEYHFSRYEKQKVNFLNSVYHDLVSMKFNQGDKQLETPQQVKMSVEWFKDKMQDYNNMLPSRAKLNKDFLSVSRITELKNLKYKAFDLKKLIRMLEEINDNYSSGNFLSVSMLGRAIVDHIPPIFQFKTFNEVANNYGTISFKKNMSHLNVSMRSIADTYLHSPIRKNESLPNENQVDFSRELDFLLAEIIRVLKE